MRKMFKRVAGLDVHKTGCGATVSVWQAMEAMVARTLVRPSGEAAASNGGRLPTLMPSRHKDLRGAHGQRTPGSYPS